MPDSLSDKFLFGFWGLSFDGLEVNLLWIDGLKTSGLSDFLGGALVLVRVLGFGVVVVFVASVTPSFDWAFPRTLDLFLFVSLRLTSGFIVTWVLLSGVVGTNIFGGSVVGVVVVGAGIVVCSCCAMNESIKLSELGLESSNDWALVVVFGRALRMVTYSRLAGVADSSALLGSGVVILGLALRIVTYSNPVFGVVSVASAACWTGLVGRVLSRVT